MDCLHLLELWSRIDESLGRQIRRMAEIVSSDSITRAFLQLSQRSGKGRLYLLDRATRRPLRVSSLSQLEIGRLYVYGEGHTLQRLAADTVLLAGKIRIPLRVSAPVQGCSPPPLVTMRTPEPELCRHSALAGAAQNRAPDLDVAAAAERRREKRAAEAQAKRHAALATRAVIELPAKPVNTLDQQPSAQSWIASEPDSLHAVVSLETDGPNASWADGLD